MNAQVDIAAACHNIRVIKQATKRAFCAVVKANAYGHGIELCRYIEKYADSFAVATTDEAENLKQLKITKPIYVLGGGHIIQKGVIPTVYDLKTAKQYIKASAPFSIKLNTGMNRSGANAAQANAIFRYLRQSGVKACSTYSHFYLAPDSAADQLEAFDGMISGYEDICGIKHICATNALTLPERYYLDMIRVGIGMYGYGAKDLKPIMEVYAGVVQVFNASAGSHIGYGEFTVPSDCAVATIRTGYGDGFRRSEKTRYVSINGKRCKILGQCCMDMTMVDVTGMRVKQGDKAYILGAGIQGQEIADIYGTIIYEVLCGFNERVKRSYE